MSGLADRLSRLMVGLYPRRWRRRYREELLALLDEHRSGLRTIASLALGALGTHLDPGYRREGIAMSGLRDPLRTAAQVTALAGVVVVVLGGLLALDIRHEQATDGVLTADHSAGLAVSSDTRLGVTAQADGIGADIVWRIGAHPRVLARFPAGAPLAFVPGSAAVLATTQTAVTEWSLANPAKPVQLAAIPGPGQAQGIAYAPSRSTVAITYARAIVLWDLASPAAPHRIATIPLAPGPGGPNAAASNQNQIAFSPDGHTLAAVTARNTVSLWDVSKPSVPQYLATVGRNAGPVAALVFSPTAPQLAYLGNGAVTVIDLTDPARQARSPVPGITPGARLYQTNGGHSYALAYSPDGTRLTAVAVGSYQAATCTWNVTSLTRPLPATCRTGHTHIDGSITFTRDGTAIAGPNPRWAGKPQNPLIIWPTLLG
jgi:hypothetical protein